MKRCYVASLDQVRITRDGDEVIIEYADRICRARGLDNASPLGAVAMKDMSDQDVLDRFNEGIEAREADQWVARGDVLRCLIDESGGGGEAMPVIQIDDHKLTWQEFGRLLLTHAGWGMRLVFDLEVALDVEETGSGGNSQRPGLVRVMDAARRGEIAAIIVWKLDRFGRSALDLLTRLRELESGGTRFIALTQGIDLRPGGDSMSRLLLTMLSAVAEFERDIIVERTRLGLERARREGRKLGRPRVPTPPAEDVRILKQAGYTWPEVALQLECTVWAARSVTMAAKGSRR